MSPAVPDWLRALYPFSSHWLEQPGGRQHFLDEGRGHPVLMCHGNPTWSFYYRGLAQAVVAAGGRAIAPDHLGCGLSDKPAGWSYRLADHIENTRRLIEDRGLERFSLVVHDWGGPIGLGAALAFPERIERIVILNTAAFRSRRMPWRIALCRMPLFGDLAVRYLNAFAGPATRMTTVRPLTPELRRAYLWPYRSAAARVAVSRFVQDIPRRPAHPSYATLTQVEEGLAELRGKPVQITWGGRDWCFDRSFFEEWQRRLPEAKSDWLADCGHYVLEDGGRALHERLARFLLP
ncbi:MAG: alpha/beta fold hydrolase [Verrucomicrobiota bacterium]